MNVCRLEGIVPILGVLALFHALGAFGQLLAQPQSEATRTIRVMSFNILQGGW